MYFNAQYSDLSEMFLLCTSVEVYSIISVYILQNSYGMVKIDICMYIVFF